MLTDTHCHLDFYDETEVPEIINRAASADACRLITVGTSLERSHRAVAIAERHEDVWATVGIHPDAAGEVTDHAVSELASLAGHSKVVAVGEIGLDLWHSENPPLDVQRSALLAQAEMARQLNLPVVLHSRQAPGETLELLPELAGLRGVVHCFEGDLDFAEEILSHGFLVSFTANVTYPKNDNLREVIKRVPLEKMMLETDAPFLPPQPLRGKRNEPAQVISVAEVVAAQKKMTLTEVAAGTSATATDFFTLPAR